MNKVLTKLVSFFLVLGLTAAIAGCGGAPAKEASSSSSSSAAAELPKVIIGQSSWLGYAPLFIAQDKGFFKAHAGGGGAAPGRAGEDHRYADEIRLFSG